MFVERYWSDEQTPCGLTWILQVDAGVVMVLKKQAAIFTQGVVALTGRGRDRPPNTASRLELTARTSSQALLNLWHC